MKKLTCHLLLLSLLGVFSCTTDINYANIDTLAKLEVECHQHQQSNYIEGDINDTPYCLGQTQIPLTPAVVTFTDTSWSTYTYKLTLPIQSNGKTVELKLAGNIYKDSLTNQNNCVFSTTNAYTIIHQNFFINNKNTGNSAALIFTWDKNNKHNSFAMQTKDSNNTLKVKDLSFTNTNGKISGTVTLEGDFQLNSFDIADCYIFCYDYDDPNVEYEIAKFKNTIIKFDFIQQ